jgi:hypothetical protein
MNDGVKLLLERMKTNPEEFAPEYDGGVTKWGIVIGHYRTYLTAEDNKALEDAWKETVGIAMQEKFTQAVMKELLAPEEDVSLGKPWYTEQRLMPLATTTQEQSLGEAQHQIQVEHIKAHLEVLRKQKSTPIVGVTQTT